MPSNVRRARIGERIHRLIDTYCKFALALWAVLLVFLAAAIALWIWLENGQFSHDEFFTIVIVIWVLVFVVSLVLGIMGARTASAFRRLPKDCGSGPGGHIFDRAEHRAAADRGPQGVGRA